MEKMIATNKKGYNQNRNFVELQHGYHFIEERDIFSTLLNQYFRITRKVTPIFQFLHYRPGSSNIKLRHFFNTVSFNNVPFIVTFETILPRLGDSPSWIRKKAIKRLTSNNCKKIIAMSQNAFDQQISYLKKNFPQYVELLRSKMIVLHPPQKKIIEDYNEKTLPSGRIVFTLIGTDFFRKGGREILNVFEKLVPNFPELQLNIVSTLLYGDYASKTSRMDYDKALDIIQKFPENIKHFNALSNERVLNLFRDSHIGLLPTWGDSYGYSVLEAQAAGCPVITTDLRALPEINNNDIGWIIEVPKLSSGNGKIESKADRLHYQKILEDGLLKHITSILQNPAQIRIKGEKAMKNILENHNSEYNSIKLKKIYEDIIN